MRFCFRYDCEVAAILPDGTMTTMLCPVGVEFVGVDIHYPYVTDIQNTTIELADGITLVNVPVEAVDWESMNADCV